MFPRRVDFGDGETGVVLFDVCEASPGYHGPLAIVRFDGAIGGDFDVSGCTLLCDMDEVAT